MEDLLTATLALNTPIATNIQKQIAPDGDQKQSQPLGGSQKSKVKSHPKYLKIQPNWLGSVSFLMVGISH